MKPVSQLSHGFRAVFDDQKSVPFAGLVIPLRLADRLGIRDAVNVRVTGMDRRRRRNSGDKTLNVVAMLLAGGDFLSDVNMLRSGATLQRLGYRWFSESRLGEWLRSLTDTDLAGFADALTETTATAWDFGFGPDLSNNSKSDPLIIDVDGTITETYGRTKVGTGARNYKGIHGYHPMLAVEAATGQIITTMLRPGNTSPANSVNEFTKDTLRRVRRLVGDSAALCLRADSGFYLRELFDLCQQYDTRFSVTVRQHKPVQQLITDIANDQWHKVDHGPQHRIDIAAVVFHIKGRHSNSRPPIPCRLIVRRVTTPADTGQSQPRLFDLTDHHAFVTDQPGDPATLWHRQTTEP